MTLTNIIFGYKTDTAEDLGQSQHGLNDGNIAEVKQQRRLLSKGICCIISNHTEKLLVCLTVWTKGQVSHLKTLSISHEKLYVKFLPAK